MSLLNDITVLDLASVGPGARASAWLADFGADVIKVVPVPRRSGVQIAAPEHAYSGGRGTRRIAIDLKADEGRETFLRLAASVAVVIESFRPGVVARLGIGYDDVRALNHGIVYCSTTGYGQTGERSGWAGHDLNYLAMGGFLASTGRGLDGKPPVPGSSIADGAGGGMHAAMSILAALTARASSGDGCYLDVAIVDGVLSLMGLQIDAHLATGATAPPGSAPLHANFACYDTYEAGDGGWLAVAAIESVFWANLCTALGLPQACIARQWQVDEQPAIREQVAAVFATGSRDEWADLLCATDTCVTPVLSVPEIVAAEQRSDRLTAARRADGSSFAQLSPMLAGAERLPSYDVPAPGTTQTEEILSGAGLSADEIEKLRETGVVA